jgi:hypothetical protein
MILVGGVLASVIQPHRLSDMLREAIAPDRLVTSILAEGERHLRRLADRSRHLGLLMLPGLEEAHTCAMQLACRAWL